MTVLRFGVVSESVRADGAWLDYARQVEDSGIDVLLLRDHFSAGPFGQQLAPFSGLAAATTRLRVGTLVLSNDFRHPAIVAHEAASLHLLSGGRFGHRGADQPARVERDQRRAGLADAHGLHRQPGPDPGRPAGAAAAVRLVVPRGRGGQPGRTGGGHQRPVAVLDVQDP
jgi:hypothetical protein